MQTNSTNMTNETVMEEVSQIVVIGWPSYEFYLIHGTGLVFLAVSIIFSCGVLAYMLRPGRTISFYSELIGERLVVYLAICDLLYSVSHSMDHVAMTILKEHPPEIVCTIFGAILNEFAMAQSLMITYVAANAFSMVVMERKINTGVYDWRLLVAVFGIPAAGVVVIGSFGFYGPSGAW